MKFVASVPSDPIIDVYEIRIKAMHGDADYFETVTVGLFHKDEEEHLMIDLVETLNRMKEDNPNCFLETEGFNRWFNAEELTEEEWEALGEAHQDFAGELSWPADVYGNAASVVSFLIVYYDWAGRECPVEIVY